MSNPISIEVTNPINKKTYEMSVSGVYFSAVMFFGGATVGKLAYTAGATLTTSTIIGFLSLPFVAGGIMAALALFALMKTIPK